MELTINHPAYYYDEKLQCIRVGYVINFNSMFVTLGHYQIGNLNPHASIERRLVSTDLNRLWWSVQVNAPRIKPPGGAA